MGSNPVMKRLGTAVAGLLLLASCAGGESRDERFAQACREAGHTEGSASFESCIKDSWARFRYVPKSGGR